MFEAAGLPVCPAAIVLEDFVGCGIEALHAASEGIEFGWQLVLRGRCDGGGSSRRVVAADDDISDALFEFADIAGPVVVGWQAAIDSEQYFGGEFVFFGGGDAFDDLGDEILEHFGVIASLFGE